MMNRKPQGFPSSDPNKRSIANMTREELIALIGGGGGGGLSSIAVVLDGGGSDIPDATSLDLVVPFNCNIVGAYLRSTNSGNITILVSSDGSFPPSTPISSGFALSGSDALSDTTLSGWTTSLSAGNNLRFAATSISGVSLCTVQLIVERT